jgi:hypothetical protein
MADEPAMPTAPPNDATQDADPSQEAPRKTTGEIRDDAGEEEEPGEDDMWPGADAASRLKALTAGVRDQDDLERELAQQVCSETHSQRCHMECS